MDHGISQPTVSNIVWEVANNICARANEWIAFPSTDDQLRSAIQSWQRTNIFPYAIGAIDCTHVSIQKPSEFGDEYINRKGFPSFNVQAICNSSATFTNVVCTWPGSVHDARVWSNSLARPIMENNTCGALLIGDEGYGNMPWLMTPFRNPNTAQQLLYNQIHTQERVVIERAFGQLKARFPILKGKMRLHTERVPTIVVACFVLHNVAKYLREENIENEDDFHDIDPPAPFHGNSAEDRGRNRRLAIAEELYNNQM